MQTTTTRSTYTTRSQSTREWVKNSPHPLASLLRRVFFAVRHWQCPEIPVVHSLIYRIHQTISSLVSSLLRIFYWTPLFSSKCVSKPKRLYLYSGMPQILGNIEISVGDSSRISGLSTFTGRTTASSPSLSIGSNVDIGWQTTIAVGTQVIISDNVRIAGRCFLAGYPGHPMNPLDRANGKPDTDDQAGPIVLQKNVWLASGVSVMPNVVIGENTVVAAGSIVTKSLPANVLAAGIPAKVIRSL